uniref:Uncharacterized protein n=1 Tax=Ditylum brightwellii TaxID=49249 RepID=A0A7S1YLY7_9STRA|mmetsp:Transcript_10834/g.16126  ORF Transcript_10834/g.16126 Transcript_10834/m.16126 type:complete len:330 (+) Transcript_10834:55-1044(+)
MKLYCLLAMVALTTDFSSGFSTSKINLPRRSHVPSRFGLSMLPNDLGNEVHSIAVASHGLIQGDIFHNIDPRGLLESYTGLLRDHPISTKALTAASLAVMGDAVAQTRGNGSETPPSYDIGRAFTFAVFAAVYTGAFQHFWFNWLDGHVNDFFNSHYAIHVHSQYGWVTSSLYQMKDAFIPTPLILGLEAITKVCTNQFVMVPLAYMPLFFAITGTLRGLSVHESVDRAKGLVIPLLIKNYSFWLPVQFIQFYAIDPNWQIPYLCVAGLIWNAILSSMAGNTTAGSDKEGDSIILSENGNYSIVETAIEDAVVEIREVQGQSTASEIAL